jgi:hypothetical protein
MLEPLKRRVRPKAREKIDNLVGPLYVREEHLRSIIDELTRMLADRFDAEAEENAIFGARLSAVADAVAELQEDVRRLRAELEGAESRRSRPAS